MGNFMPTVLPQRAGDDKVLYSPRIYTPLWLQLLATEKDPGFLLMYAVALAGTPR